MTANGTIVGRVLPSAQVLALAGVDLQEALPPVVRVEEVREVAVVLPRSRRPEREVFLQACEDDKVPVVVRPSGGGAVVLSPGMVAVSLLADAEGTGLFPEAYFTRFGAAVTRGLAACGVTWITRRGVSDLCLGERKIAGSALRLWRNRVLYQLSLLVDPDLSLMERYLPMPSRQPDYRRDRPHADFVTSLAAAGFRVGAQEVARSLRLALAAEISAPPRVGAG